VKVQSWFDYFYLVPLFEYSDKKLESKGGETKGERKKVIGEKEAHTGRLASDVQAPR